MYDKRGNVMMGKPINNDEEGNGFGGTELELKDYYCDEINRNLDSIEASLNKLKDNLQDQESAFAILEAARSIADLAMVHGYEGIESLANKMGYVLEKARKSDLSQSLLSNLQETVKIIRKVFTLSDDRLERDVIRRTASRIIAIEEGTEEKKEELPFDIKEPESLYFLMSEDEKESEEALISRSIENKLKNEARSQADFIEFKQEIDHDIKVEKNQDKKKKTSLMNKFLHLFGH